MDFSTTPCYVSAYVIRLTAEGARYLLIRRCEKSLNGTWQMVTGGIEPGETASAAALREIREETGLIPSTLYAADAVETFYMQANDKITFVPVFVSFVEDPVVRLSPEEHDAYEWLTFEEARERLVWAEQKRVITHVQDVFILNKPNPLLLIKNTIPSPPIKPMISRTGVYGIIMQNQKLLLVKQCKGPHTGKWDLPGGGIESGETIEEALRRELIEEVGIEFSEMTFFSNLTAISQGIDEEGSPYDFHQIGLVYQIHGSSQSNFQTSERAAHSDPYPLSLDLADHPSDCGKEFAVSCQSREIPCFEELSPKRGEILRSGDGRQILCRRLSDSPLDPVLKNRTQAELPVQMEYAWIDYEQIELGSLSPFVRQILVRLRKNPIDYQILET